MLLTVYFLILCILYTTGGALPAGLAGAVVAFLLLTLPVVGIIVGALLLGRANRRGKRIEKRRKSVELIECVEKREEIPLAGTSSTGNDSERQINNNFVYHYERIQPNDQPGYESVDVGNYNVAEAAKNISSEDIRQNARERNQQDAQPRGKQNAVYAVVDKSKKKKQEKTQGGASATTTQNVYTEKQHYEWSSVFGQDWFGNVVGESGRQEQQRESGGSKSRFHTDEMEGVS